MKLKNSREVDELEHFAKTALFNLFLVLYPAVIWAISAFLISCVGHIQQFFPPTIHWYNTGLRLTLTTDFSYSKYGSSLDI